MKTCRGKPCYTKKEALSAKNHRLRSHTKAPDYLREYRCPHCNFYHRTSKPHYDDERTTEARPRIPKLRSKRPREDQDE